MDGIDKQRPLFINKVLVKIKTGSLCFFAYLQDNGIVMNGIWFLFINLPFLRANKKDEI